jgi:trk system potassium uptake protein
MAQRYLVVGLGRFGTALALGLSERGCDVIAVDSELDKVDAVKDRIGHAIELDSTDPAALQSLDARSCNTAIVAMGEGFEAAVLTVTALKECGVARVIARARNPRHARVLRAVGADEIIEVESEVGRNLAESLAGNERRTQA